MSVVHSRRRTKPADNNSCATDEESPPLSRPRPTEKSDSHKRHIILLFQDVAIGILFGMFGMCVLLLLDYCAVINLETARTFRKTARMMLNNAEVIESLEEETGRKFLPVNDFNAMKDEIEYSKLIVTQQQKLLMARSHKERALKEKAIPPIKRERDALMKLAGLHEFCDDCPWLKVGKMATCRQRVQYMIDEFYTPPVYAMDDAMGNGINHCKKKDG